MSIIYPVFTLVVFTFVVLIALATSRFISVRRRDVNPKLYVLMAGYEPPAYVQKLTRNFANLLETPILFYLLAVLMIALEINDPMLVNLAWLFVGARIVHSAIHITYNHVMHRFGAFLVSVVTLLVMWIKFIAIVG